MLSGILPAQTVMRTSLTENWEYSQAGKAEWHPASVPGTIHTDLFRNGQIPDPFYGNNEDGLQWIDKVEWEYRTNIDVDPKTYAYQNLVLDFEGLDTYADVFLNEEKILSTNNMFRAWQVDVKPLLKPGKNSLRILFHSAVEVAVPRAAALPYKLPAPNDPDDQKISVFVRKAAYHFGWDWGPRFVTVGIWRPAYLTAWNDARLTDLHTTTSKLTDKEANLIAHLEIEASEAQKASVAIVVSEDTLFKGPVNLQAGLNQLDKPLNIRNPQRWWPTGAGKPYLYDLTAVLLNENGKPFHEKAIRVGLRTIELIQEKDSIGISFYFKVNDQPIFIKGTNYIPGDNFIPRARSKRATLVESIKKANMNMVRVWGGGIYEDDEFYDLCDENGILVWQDFMFACGMYPSDQQFLDNVTAEVQQNVKRLRHHPSIALWCGNNEIEVAWFNWGWQKEYELSPTDSTKIWNDYENLFKELIPREVKALDPDRAYVASSPISNWGTPDNFTKGDMHYWGVWHGEEPFDEFRNNIPRFMSEFGFQSYPEVRTLATVSSAAGPDAESMESRQKSYKGTRLIEEYMERWYTESKDYESFLIMTQLLQAEGMKIAIENQRIEQPRNMGSLYWQLNDCWPGPSWSSIDYAGRWKALHYWMQHLYAPVMLVAEQDDLGLSVRAASDLKRARFGTLALRLKSFNGDILWTLEQAVEIEPNTVKEYMRVPREVFPDQFDLSTTVLEIILHARGKTVASNLLYFARPRDLQLPDPEFSYRCEPAEDGYLVEVRAQHHLKNVEFALEGEPAEFSDNYFDLAPGGIRQIFIKAPTITSEQELVKRLRVRQLTDWISE